MPGSSDCNANLEQLRIIQAEIAGVEARLDALESGYSLDSQTVDRYVASLISNRPARYEDFLTEAELTEIARRHELSLSKTVECDGLDYALAAACGVISGLLDILFVRTPGEGAFGELTDNSFKAVVVRFAKVFKDDQGNQLWKPKGANGESLESAIRFLERMFKVGYDQAKSADAANIIEQLSTKNHHDKSLGHYPDLFGLVASICNQFTGTSSFFDSEQGRIVVVAGTGNGIELQGDTVPAKIFAGFVNWLGHCMSDVAGSSGTKVRGQGLPLPFTELFQLCNFGKIPIGEDEQQTFANIMTRVYEQGYDLRHGVAASLPVMANDLLIRVVFVVRKHFVDGVEWNSCLPGEDCPELQRMVTTGIGSMCLVDLAHAAVTSWGNWLEFFGSLNIAAWVRIGQQGIRELERVAKQSQVNLLSQSDEISENWEKLQENSRTLLNN